MSVIKKSKTISKSKTIKGSRKHFNKSRKCGSKTRKVKEGGGGGGKGKGQGQGQEQEQVKRQGKGWRGMLPTFFQRRNSVNLGEQLVDKRIPRTGIPRVTQASRSTEFPSIGNSLSAEEFVKPAKQEPYTRSLPVGNMSDSRYYSRESYKAGTGGPQQGPADEILKLPPTKENLVEQQRELQRRMTNQQVGVRGRVSKVTRNEFNRVSEQLRTIQNS